jgi:hypothetical protein
MNTPNQTKAIEILRALRAMGVELNGCGCCGSNTITIDGKTYPIDGGTQNDGKGYHYSVGTGEDEFTIYSNGLDENSLR